MENLLELAKLALLFYANPENYKKTSVYDCGLIGSDCGSQAKFVLDNIEKYYKTNNIDQEIDIELQSLNDYNGYIELMNELIKEDKKI